VCVCVCVHACAYVCVYVCVIVCVCVCMFMLVPYHLVDLSSDCRMILENPNIILSIIYQSYLKSSHV